ncbi:Aminopeptidase 2 mitochondrial [Quaeritorhiza haematococci]|nr:Aminopeptidase 2 mitochondrial [Quaeritorhiza haematococci]
MCVPAAAADPAASAAANTSREVLPTTVTPSHYTLVVDPNLETFLFNGIVDVSLKVNETTNTIVCNSKDLEIHSAKVTYTHLKTESSQPATKIDVDNTKEIVTFHFESPIPVGSDATLTISFTGSHSDKLSGFYRSAYTDKEGKKKYCVVTQFEATDARRAFPCWDEPALKATFDATLRVAPHLTALGNMNVVEEKDVEVEVEEKGEKKKVVLREVKFARTPIMSTYLVAFAVGEFDYIETTAHPKKPADAKPITVRVYTMKGESELGRFGLEVGARTLEFFSEYFDIPYPLPKMDMIAIPDFSHGAMENWGLVTYRTVYLLYDEKSSSAKTKQGIAYVVGHELAHQWFGNLVTMDWWSDLWLNEGFATFVGWMAVDNLFPEWDVWTQFVIGDLASGLSLDALRSSHPIEVDVKSPSEINQIFDAISYSKGASLIRMLNHFLGSQTFMSGVRTYLKEYAYSNARTQDLWRHLSTVSSKDVATMMKAWTRETGYPLVTVVEEKVDEQAGKCTLKLRQERYLSTGDLKETEDNVTWWIPLGVSTHENPTSTIGDHVLKEKEGTITFPYNPTSTSKPYWKLNFRFRGFFRVKLQEEQLARLGRIVEADAKAFGTSDRVGLLTDAFALAQAGYARTTGALEVLKGFKNEEEYIVLNEMVTRLNSLISAWYKQPPTTLDKLLTLKRNIFAPKVASVGWEEVVKTKSVMNVDAGCADGVAGLGCRGSRDVNGVLWVPSAMGDAATLIGEMMVVEVVPVDEFIGTAMGSEVAVSGGDSVSEKNGIMLDNEGGVDDIGVGEVGIAANPVGDKGMELYAVPTGDPYCQSPNFPPASIPAPALGNATCSSYKGSGTWLCRLRWSKKVCIWMGVVEKGDGDSHIKGFEVVVMVGIAAGVVAEEKEDNEPDEDVVGSDVEMKRFPEPA